MKLGCGKGLWVYPYTVVHIGIQMFSWMLKLYVTQIPAQLAAGLGAIPCINGKETDGLLLPESALAKVNPLMGNMTTEPQTPSRPAAFPCK